MRVKVKGLNLKSLEHFWGRKMSQIDLQIVLEGKMLEFADLTAKHEFLLQLGVYSKHDAQDIAYLETRGLVQVADKAVVNRNGATKA